MGRGREIELRRIKNGRLGLDSIVQISDISPVVTDNVWIKLNSFLLFSSFSCRWIKRVRREWVNKKKKIQERIKSRIRSGEDNNEFSQRLKEKGERLDPQRLFLKLLTNLSDREEGKTRALVITEEVSRWTFRVDKYIKTLPRKRQASRVDKDAELQPATPAAAPATPPCSSLSSSWTCWRCRWRSCWWGGLWAAIVFSVTFYIQKAVQGRFPPVWEKRFLSLWQKAARPDNGEKSFCTFWGFTAIRSRNFCQFSVICGYFDVCCSSPDSTRC